MVRQRFGQGELYRPRFSDAAVRGDSDYYFESKKLIDVGALHEIVLARI
jgi:hypothetical protein